MKPENVLNRNISAVGYLKIDETKPERADYLIASLRSLKFMGINITIALQTPTEKLASRVLEEIGMVTIYPEDFYRQKDYFQRTHDHYGEIYSKLISGKSGFILNFIEDHFCVCDDINYIVSCIKKMAEYKVDVCKATFNKIELNSISTINPLYNDEQFFIYDNNYQNNVEYQKHYGSRYYIGVNFITTAKFAKKFWARKLGQRPHEYEIMQYDETWRHVCMIPKQEILCSIDDPHGEAGTELLSRDNKKFKQIYDSVIQRPVI